ncbi:MAG: hypothetical protein U0W24_13695 [Bacteroidales bacterium]
MNKLLLIPFLVVIGSFTAKSQSDSILSPYDVSDTLSKDFGLFTNDEILNISLRFDVSEYRRKKPKEEYMDALLTYHISDKDSVNKQVRLKTRGEFRNSYCSFPPIRLNFKKTEFQKDDLKDLGKVKMVTHCNSGNDSYVFKEYLIYKLYNVITDYSFRVRLMKVEYINTGKKSKSIYSYAFLIEPVEYLAKRLNIIPVESLNLGQSNVKPEFMDRMAVFCYMIGNTDWSVPNQHNCKLFSQPLSENPSLGLIIPYDFDYSGLVNASYAVPPENLGIKSVLDRKYLGYCRTQEEFSIAVKEFSDKKAEIYKTINEFSYLSERQKKEMINYLDGFYEQFDKQNNIVLSILKDCKEK